MISSPTRPFTGRQSWASPANFSLLQTPAKRKRASASPSKSAQSFRLDDIVLPASPTLKLNGPQSSKKTPSPAKGQAEDSSSPWRIRVTVEASQDDENNGGSPARKKFKPETTTTKVPLRDDRGVLEEIPKRRRGRPRKSSVGVASHTGGPGSTPVPKAVGELKTTRGRPRKTSSGLDNAKNSEEHSHTPIRGSERRWSPVNLAGDGDSDDGFPDTPTAVGSYGRDQDIGNYEANEPVGSSPPRNSIEQVDKPNVGFANQAQNTVVQPSPSRTPSPSPENDDIPQENTLYAGHTPTARRVYPTPTSSSLLEEEQQGQERATSGTSQDYFRRSANRVAGDPTDDHKEFDTIIESEGFSMVSLDTLPSANQHKLASGKKSAQRTPELPKSESYTNMIRNASAGDGYGKTVRISPAHQQDTRSHGGHNLPKSPPSPPDRLPSYYQHLDTQRAAAETHPSPSVTPPSQSPVATQKKSAPSLARVVRVGLALQGALEHQRPRSSLQSHSMRFEPGGPDTFRGPRERLEHLFEDMKPEARKELRVGLGIGEVLANRRKEAEGKQAIETANQRATSTADIGEIDRATTGKNEEQRVEVRTPQQAHREGSRRGTFGSEMKRREAEWQREREANSRDIQMANSSQVIVIDSDNQAAGGNEDPVSEHESNQDIEPQALSEAESEPEAEDENEPGSDLTEEKPEGDSEPEANPEAESDTRSESGPESDQEASDEEDIWQQEAKDLHPDDSKPRPRARQISSRRRIIPSSDGAGLDSPAQSVSGNGQMPFPSKSQVKRLQEQEVDLSVWFNARGTPNRNRYFYGSSTPQSIISKQSPMSNQSPVQRPVPSANGKLELHAIGDQSGNDTPSGPDGFDIPRHGSEGHEEGELARDQNSKDGGDDKTVPKLPEHEVHDFSPLIPETTRRNGDDDAQAPSLFQKITSKTPAWLKAPAIGSAEQPISTVEEEGQEEQGAEEGEEADLRSIEHATADEEDISQKPVPEALSSDDMHASEDDVISEGGEQTPVQYPQLPIGDDHQELDNDEPRGEKSTESKVSKRTLALSGDFTDSHYALLSRLYDMAKQDPELFPYRPTRGRTGIIGDWIWTSDGRYGVPVTEGQFAIIDRFVQQLVRADLVHGGSGRIGWTDADLHRRLISIIIGEQIRAARELSRGYGEEDEE